jgi:hypothetical protein
VEGKARSTAQGKPGLCHFTNCPTVEDFDSAIQNLFSANIQHQRNYQSEIAGHTASTTLVFKNYSYLLKELLKTKQ